MLTIHATPYRVWDALTNPDSLKQWLFDTAIDVISDWQEGSLIVFKGNINGHPFINTGTILKLEKEKIFQYDYWSDLSNLPDRPDAVIEFSLQPAANATMLTFTCSHIANDIIYGHLKMYWITTLDILKKFLEKSSDG